MSNVLDDNKQQQILALGRLGWSLRRIEQATAVRRETVSGYLKAAGIAVRGRGRRSESKAKPAIAEEVSTDLGAKPAITSAGVSTDPERPPPPGRAPSASACEPYREIIAEALGAWAQCRGHLAGPGRRPRLSRRGTRVSAASSWRCAAATPAEARVVITTAPGEEGQVDYGEGPMVRDRGTGKYRRDAPLRPDAGLLAQIGAAAGVAIERADLGGAARARVSSAGRHRPRHRPRQSERGRAHARHLRSRAQSALSRRARALRRRRAAVPRRRSRSQRAKSKPASATRRRRR